MTIALHFSEKKKKSVQNLILATLIAMGLYGIYKNGISYVFLGRMDWNQVFSLCLFPIISTITHIGINLFQKKKAFENICEGVLFGLMVPPLFPIWLFLLLELIYFLCKIIHLRIPISFLLFFKLLLCLSSLIFQIPYENLIENTTPYLYGILDLFLGRSVGNLGTTSIILLIVLYLFLNLDFYYKKDLPIYALVTFFFFSFIYSLFHPGYLFIREFLNSHLWFTAIVLLPSNDYSPATKNGRILYGILFGFLSFVFLSFLNIIDGCYYLLVFFQLLLPLVRYLWIKKQSIVYVKKA